jgi:integrative and conjugative element protein (TIGR02256 family)
MALEARPMETGGILLGWHEEDTIVVSHVLQIGDPRASMHQYIRNDEAAQRALDTFQSVSPDGKIGYVGEWHSHPVAQPPSQIDYDSLRQLAQEAQHQVAMAVFAVSNDDSVTPFLVTANRDGAQVAVHRHGRVRHG